MLPSRLIGDNGHHGPSQPAGMVPGAAQVGVGQSWIHSCYTRSHPSPIIRGHTRPTSSSLPTQTSRIRITPVCPACLAHQKRETPLKPHLLYCLSPLLCYTYNTPSSSSSTRPFFYATCFLASTKLPTNVLTVATNQNNIQKVSAWTDICRGN